MPGIFVDPLSISLVENRAAAGEQAFKEMLERQGGPGRASVAESGWSNTWTRCAPRSREQRARSWLVGARGFEPLTSSVSGKRSPPELSARAGTVPRDLSASRGGDRNRTGVRGFAGPCLTTRPPRRTGPVYGTIPERPNGRRRRPFDGADDGIRTRDPHLGKVVLYQLSHVRVHPRLARLLRCFNRATRSPSNRIPRFPGVKVGAVPPTSP